MMKYYFLSIFVLISACRNSDKYEDHNSYHEMDDTPFYFSTEYKDEELVLSITPKKNGDVYFPVFFEYSDSGDNFLGDLVLSKTKVKSALSYTQKKNSSGIVSLVRIPAEGREFYNEQRRVEMAIYIYENGFNREERNGFKIHRYGHVWGEHFHIEVAAETD